MLIEMLFSSFKIVVANKDVSQKSNYFFLAGGTIRTHSHNLFTEQMVRILSLNILAPRQHFKNLI